jgi:hypothetical protein
MIKNSYNLEALNLAIERDNATLLNSYDKVTKRTRIYFKCHCGEEHYKKCLEIISRAGAFCKECTIKRGIKKLHSTLEKEKNKEPICTIKSLNDTITRDNAILLENYEVITIHSKIKFKCNCGENSEKNSLQLIKVSGAFCKNCTRKTWTLNIKKTNLEKYNVECSVHAPHIKEQIINNNLQKHGVENVFQIPEVREKIKQTMLNKYNVDNPNKTPEIREKIRQTCLEKYNVDNPMKNDMVKENLKQSVMNKYNVQYYSQTQEYKEQYKNTCLKKYNVEHTLKLPEIREKIKQTFIQKYNVTNPNKTPEVREKIRQTCLKRYNVEHHSQCQEIQERQQKNAKKYKEYKMPSGEIRKVQGYEPLALDELVKTYEESDIITDRKGIPRISYKIEEKQKYYFPDIYIKSQNKIIEVKSTWTYKCKEDNIQEKVNATKSAGYEYEIWIYDDKGNKTIK